MATMSRLEKLEEKRNLRKATLLGIGTIALVVVLAVAGIPALIRMVVFFGDVKSNGKTVDKNDVIPPSPPRLFTIYDATNSAVTRLDGLSEAKSKIFLTQNTQSKGNTITTDDGSFAFDNLILTEGDNRFVAVAVDEAGNQSSPSREISVYYSNKQPKLEIESPTDKQQFGWQVRDGITVKGTTDPDTRITLNDRIIIVGADGKFTRTFVPSAGDNALTFVATNKAGNQTKKELTVTYSP